MGVILIGECGTGAELIGGCAMGAILIGGCALGAILIVDVPQIYHLFVFSSNFSYHAKPQTQL